MSIMAAMMPSASDAASITASTRRMQPEITSPSRISPIELVSIMPGIKSMISPMITLSACSMGSSSHIKNTAAPPMKEATN